MNVSVHCAHHRVLICWVQRFGDNTLSPVHTFVSLAQLLSHAFVNVVRALRSLVSTITDEMVSPLDLTGPGTVSFAHRDLSALPAFVHETTVGMRLPSAASRAREKRAIKPPGWKNFRQTFQAEVITAPYLWLVCSADARFVPFCDP